LAAAEGALGGRGAMGAAPTGRGGVGAIGAPGRGAGGRVLTTVAAVVVAGEPAADVEPGLGGAGRTEGFFCSSGFPSSPPSEDDKLTNHRLATEGCTLQ
jgi:hypothetical protein